MPPLIREEYFQCFFNGKEEYMEINAIKLLIEKNSDVKVRKNGKTPLIYVCKQEKKKS